MTQTPERLTEAELDDALRLFNLAKSDSGHAKMCNWAIVLGPRLIAQARQSNAPDDGEGTFAGLKAVVQYANRNTGGWANMAAFDSVLRAERYADECSGDERPWEYRSVDLATDEVHKGVQPLPAPPSSQDKEPG